MCPLQRLEEIMFIYLATDNEKLEWQKISVAEDDECWKKRKKMSRRALVFFPNQLKSTDYY